MTSSEYYYGVSFEVWQDMKYFDAIKKRVECAKKLYEELWIEQQNSRTELPFEKRKRLWKVEKALRDNQKLLNEKNGLV